MLLIPFIPFYAHRKRATIAPTPPPATLTLVSATYIVAHKAMIVLSFDRAIDIAGLDGNAIVVVDGIEEDKVYVGTGAASLDDPNTLRIILDETEDSPGALCADHGYRVPARNRQPA